VVDDPSVAGAMGMIEKKVETGQGMAASRVTAVV